MNKFKNYVLTSVAFVSVALVLTLSGTGRTGARDDDDGVARCKKGTQLLATGLTTPFLADKPNDGVPGQVSVPDDGTLQIGVPFRYVDNADGTVTDLNTCLMWEKKCDTCLVTDLHHMDRGFAWDGGQENLWEWLDLVNAEGGTGFAGHNDWRIPNIRELHSLVHYGRRPHIDPIFLGAGTFWSSTGHAGEEGSWAFVDFNNGRVDFTGEGPTFAARAVRAGPKKED